MINQIRDFETPASLYDNPCVVVLNKVCIVISTISGAQKLHGFLLHIPWGESVVDLCNVWCKDEVYLSYSVQLYTR